MRSVIIVTLLLLYSGCKERRTDAPSKAEKITISSTAQGLNGKIFSERFGELHLSRPEQEIKSAIVLFSDGSWTQELTSKSHQLSKDGIFVIGVEVSSYLTAIREQKEDCIYLAGEVERLVQSVEKGSGINSFIPAALTGEGVGSVLAEKIFYQYPSAFFGLISVDAAADSLDEIKFCEPDDSKENTVETFASQIKRITNPTIAVDQLKNLIAEIPISSGRVISSDLPQGVADLPLEVFLPDPAIAGLGGDAFVIFLTGDGGWAGIDQDLADRLLEKNIPVVGLSSLQYFWRKQTPLDGAKDLERIIHVYSGLLKRSKVILLGFSFGADVLPAFTTNLSSESRNMISSVVLLSPSLVTDFEIHISQWVGFDEVDGGKPILPEVRKLHIPVLCLYGEEEKAETICAEQQDGIRQDTLKSIMLPGDHHFDGEYGDVAAELFKFLKLNTPSSGR